MRGSAVRASGNSRTIEVLAGTDRNSKSSSGIINALKTMRHRFLLAGAFVYLTAANIIWIVRDTRPPFWDMADHELGALRISDAVENSGLSGLSEISRQRLTGFYPPFYHLCRRRHLGSIRKIRRRRSAGKSARTGRSCCLPPTVSPQGPFARLAALLRVLTRIFPIPALDLARDDHRLLANCNRRCFHVGADQDQRFSDRRWSILFGVLAG